MGIKYPYLFMRIQPEFNEFQKKIVVALAYRQGLNKSAVVKQGVYQLIKNMSENEIQSLLKQYENLTSEQKINPCK